MKDILFSLLKLLVFLLTLPLLAAFIIAFKDQIVSLPEPKEVWMLWGAGVYVALNLFIYNFKEVYVFGKGWAEIVFKPAGYFVPGYSILLIIIYEILLIVDHGNSMQPYFLLAIAFTLSMHLVQTAHEIYEADSSILKAHYLCVFGVVLIVNLFFISLLLAWVIPEFSFVGFIKSLSAQTGHFYKAVYKTLFVDSTVYQK